MTLNEYLEYVKDPLAEPKARVIFLSSGDDMITLRSFYQERGNYEVRLSDLVEENAWLPMPDEVFERINHKLEEFTSDEKAITVLGLSGYLTLLTEPNRHAAIDALRQWVDTFEDRDIICLVKGNESMNNILNSVFSNPRYRQGKRLIEVDPSNGDLAENAMCHARIMLVDAEFVDLLPDSCDTFRDYLRYSEEHPGTEDERRIVVESQGRKLAGLSADIHQITSLRCFAKAFHDIDAPELSNDALTLICEQGKTRGEKTLLETLKSHFFDEPNIETCVLNIFGRQHGATREVLWWTINNCATRESYLHFAIEREGVTADNFQPAYVTSAIDCLDKAKLYAEERKSAIMEAGVQLHDTDIRLFISQCKNESTSLVAPWLNCGTDIEKTELLNRCFAGKIVSNAVKDVYSEVAAYMSDAHVFNNPAVQQYFGEYRNLKITNRLSKDFYKTAASPQIDGIKSRDLLVQQYSNDEECALLVVDAMGVEWLPMLVTLAGKRNLGIDSVDIGYAQLPSSTAFNSIQWVDSRRLKDVKRFDNIAHNGVEAHEQRKDEENLAAELSVIGDEVLPRIAKELTAYKYKRVLVTADHGSSRLAALAWRSNPRLAQTLECEDGAEILDWRYRRKSKNFSCPLNMQETLDGEYWVVRGYDRLPKRGGGKGFEFHGGMTLEERLVPLVVFSHAGQYVPQESSNLANRQIVEKDDFDL